MADTGSRLSQNQQAVARIAMVFVALIVVGVVGYAEVMYLQVMSKVFPDGILKIVAMIGAVATGMSVLVLLIAKSYWFRPGTQMVFAWIFTGVEVLVLVLNVLISFALESGGHVDSYLALWYSLMPASPLVALVGWVLIISLDRSQQERHHAMEFEEEVAAAEREHQKQVHRARMQLRDSYLHSHVEYLRQEVDSPEVQEQIRYGASIMAAKELGELAGTHVAPRLQGPRSTEVPKIAKRSEASGELLDSGWLSRANARIEEERRHRLVEGGDASASSSVPLFDRFFKPGQVSEGGTDEYGYYQGEGGDGAKKN
jgi:signal transduction histidine kinase